MQHAWQPVSLADHRFLRPLAPLVGEAPLAAFTLTPAVPFSRTTCEGISTLRGSVGGRDVGVVLHDFRVNGGAFGKQSAHRLARFVEVMGAAGAPVVLVLDTLGLRITEGRTVFGAFEVVPVLQRFAKEHLLVTIAAGRCLGIGALVYGLGNLRLGVKGSGQLNLTGPEVMKLFFGDKVDFADLASVERQVEKTSMVHELHDDLGSALAAVARLVRQVDVGATPPSDPEPEATGSAQARAVAARTRALLAHLGTHPLEVFAQGSRVVQTHVLRRGSRAIGVFINPLGNPHNLITLETLHRYEAALGLFRALRLPLVSVLDTPGIDPRASQSDRDVLRQVLNVSAQVIDYPYPMMSVLAGRCFGGATVLAFPKLFGAKTTVALEGAQVGIMHQSIIGHLLDGAPRLRKAWDEASATQTPLLEDLVAAGIVDAVVAPEALGARLDAVLAG